MLLAPSLELLYNEDGMLFGLLLLALSMEPLYNEWGYHCRYFVRKFSIMNATCYLAYHC